MSIELATKKNSKTAERNCKNQNTNCKKKLKNAKNTTITTRPKPNNYSHTVVKVVL